MGTLLNFLKERWGIILGTAVVTIVITFGIIGGEMYISSTGFCLSCHSMSYVHDDLKKSSHYGALGADPECQDCHLPPQFLKRVESHIVDGVRGFIGEFTRDHSTKEKFDGYRAEYAHNARMNIRKWDSSPCRTCHKILRSSSDETAREHKKMETENKTCIDCHQNLAHEEVPEEDIVAGMKEGKIVVKNEEEKKEE